MKEKLGCIILAAGKGKRMKSEIAKPLHKVAGLSMVSHVIKNAEALNPDKIVVVIGNDMDDLAQEVKPYETAIQNIANGTGGAVLAAKELFNGFDGDILILYGDTPLVSTDTLQKMIDMRRSSSTVGLTFSGMNVESPNTYGRMILNDDGTLKKIVEFKEASDEEKEISLCNGGIVCADGSKLFKWLEQINNNNAKKEYYLTDLPVIAAKDNRQTYVVEVSTDEMSGANTPAELENLEKLIQTQ